MNRIALMLACMAVTGCGQNMTDQPKYQEYEPGPLFRDGRVLQAPVSGTLARGDLDREKASTSKPPLDSALLAGGHAPVDLFCAPCQARPGARNGMMVHGGMPGPPSLHIDRLRTADDQHFFDVISRGYGVMYSYAASMPPQDRWAIVAYI